MKEIVFERVFFGGVVLE